MRRRLPPLALSENENQEGLGGEPDVLEARGDFEKILQRTA